MKNLVLLACLLVAIVVAYPDKQEDRKNGKMEKEQKRKMNEMLLSCINEVGFTEEEKALLKEEHVEKVDKSKRNCVTACLVKKQGMMEGSEIKLDKIYEYIETSKQETETPEVIEKYKTFASVCYKEVSSIENKCEKVVQYLTCVQKKMDEKV